MVFKLTFYVEAKFVDFMGNAYLLFKAINLRKLRLRSLLVIFKYRLLCVIMCVQETINAL